MKPIHVKEINPDEPAIGSHEELVDAQAELIVDRSVHEAVRFGNTERSVNAKLVSIEQAFVSGNAFAGSTMPASVFKDCVFDHADLASATWVDGRLVRTRFVECRLTGVDLRLCDLREVAFEQCKLPEALLGETTLNKVRFDQCQLMNLDLAGATIETLALHNCDATSLRLVGARIGLLDLRGSNIDGISLDAGSMRGIVIDPIQAPAIAQAMGVRVLNADL